MFILCWSPKGGAGTTVVAASIGLLLARTVEGTTTIVDLGGDVPAALGISEPSGPGVAEWLVAPSAPPDALLRLATPATDALRVVHRSGRTADGDSQGRLDTAAWARIAGACAAGCEAGGHVVVDAGAVVPPVDVHHAADQSLLVVRPCYLALRRASAVASRASGAILVTEPGRALDAGDVERALGVAVLGEIPWDPTVARAVDAGLLMSRLPHALARSLRHVTVVGAMR